MINVEVLMRFGLQNRRGKWAKGLAHLYQRVDAVAHLRPPGIGENGAAAQRARAELHTSLRPTNYLAFNQPVHYVPDQFVFFAAEVLEFCRRCLQYLAGIFRSISGS